jgi:hypothetical protein
MSRRIALFASLALVVSGVAAVTSSVPASAATYYQEIQSAYGSHHCLSAQDDANGNPSQNGDNVIMWGCFSGSMQEWSFVPVLNGQDWEIVNEASGKCLDAENDQYNNPDNGGDKIQLWTCNGGHNQYWSEDLNGSGQYGAVYFNQWAIDHGHLTVLDALSANGWNADVDGDPTQIWPVNYDVNQYWTGGI